MQNHHKSPPSTPEFHPPDQPAPALLDPVQEKRFLKLLEPFINLERRADRDYSDNEYGLERMHSIAALADHPEKNLLNIHLAGTKGKGSTALLLAAMLQEAGLTCGAFTSPHLVSVRERFLINRQPVPYNILIDQTEKLTSAILRQKLAANFFEVMTVLALRLFVVQNCQYAIIETGIGGLLDATNYIPPPLCCIITSISFDHTELLGRTIPEIAAQKAGIIKPGAQVVVGPQPFPPQTMPVIEAAAKRHGCPLHKVDISRADHLTAAHLLPPVQRENLATALTAAHLLGIKPDPGNFPGPALPGRCQCLRQHPLVVIDAAHNPDSARRLVESITFLYPDTPFTVVLGIVEGKDVAGIIKALAQLPNCRFILTNPRPFKESALPALSTIASQNQLDFTIIPQIKSDRDLPLHQNLIFTGSFFTALIGAELFSQ